MNLSKTVFAPAALAASLGITAPAWADQTGTPDTDQDVQTFQCDGAAFGPYESVADLAEDVLPANVFIRAGRSSGSGFFISNDGYILTNSHVIPPDPAGTGPIVSGITVTLYDPKRLNNLGQQFNATVIGTDPELDLALLHIESDMDFACVQFADSDAVRSGERAVAIGNPLRLEFSISNGIISNVMRNLGDPFNYFQTDAAINQGNSGGSLYNMNGDVVGINTAMLSPNGGNVGLGLAIQSNDIRETAFELLNYGQAQRGAIGIRMQEAPSTPMEDSGFDNGVMITEVMPKSAASEAGLQQGDIIVMIEGETFYSSLDLSQYIFDHEPEETLAFTILRDGQVMDIAVTLGERSVIFRPRPELDQGPEDFEFPMLPEDLFPPQPE